MCAPPVRLPARLATLIDTRHLTRCLCVPGEEGGLWAWERFNQVFNWMPLAAVIEKRVICMHGSLRTALCAFV